jgi:hypothetical protein
VILLDRSIPVVVVAGALLVSPPFAGTARADVRECVEVDSQGYCIEWDVTQPGSSGGGGGDVKDQPKNEVECGWVTIEVPVLRDPLFLVRYGLALPPADLPVLWQTVRCSDGSAPAQFRWIPVATPADLAGIARGRIVGLLPQPLVATSPPAGTPSIVDIPVFVEVTNWTGVITQSECAGGLCVTVSATPTLTFAPGEPGSVPLSCRGSGTRYEPSGSSMDEQMSAEGACAYPYSLRTGIPGRPSAWEGSVSVTWRITWTASSGQSGVLPSVTRSTRVTREVAEVQTVVIGGATP